MRLGAAGAIVGQDEVALYDRGVRRNQRLGLDSCLHVEDEDSPVSMAIISYFIPYLFMFASMIRLQREPVGPEVIRVPGGRPVAVALAALGFAVTTVSIGLALIPAEDEPNKVLAVTKVAGLTILLVAGGALVYFLGRRREHARP